MPPAEMRFHKYTKEQCARFREGCNFTDSERAVFDLLVRNRSRTEIAASLALSISTTDRRIRSIKDKICNMGPPGS